MNPEKVIYFWDHEKDRWFYWHEGLSAPVGDFHAIGHAIQDFHKTLPHGEPEWETIHDAATVYVTRPYEADMKPEEILAFDKKVLAEMTMDFGGPQYVMIVKDVGINPPPGKGRVAVQVFELLSNALASSWNVPTHDPAIYRYDPVLQQWEKAA